MKTDVLLIKPDFLDIAVLPPLGLGYLASSLSARGLSVRVHDNTLYEYNDEKLYGTIKDASPSVVGISAATPMIRRAHQIASLARKACPDALVALGGPHPSNTVTETLASPDVDVVVIGEGETTFPEVVAAFLSGSRDFSGIEGGAFKKDGAVVLTPAREMARDLDSLPFPDLDIMPVEQYFDKGGSYGILQKQKRSIPIIASRGCPSNCTFCMRFMGRKFRVRGAENIVDEIAYRQKKYGVSEFNFLDDNFTLHRKRVAEVCALIHKRGLKIQFRFPNGVREDFLTEDTLDALKSVGCYHLDFGIESGSQKVLDLMKKGKTVGKIAEKVRLCARRGFKLSASFLFGTPGETIEDMEETIRFAKSLPLDSASFAIVIPYPGTELRDEVVSKGYLVHSDYEDYNPVIEGFRPAIETPDWSGADLIRMQMKANREFFLRPKQVLKLLPTMASPVHMKRYMESFFRIIKK